MGSGVTKGDIVVGGEIITSKSSWIDGKENVETKTSYARSKGKILGTFERTVTFTQPFEDKAEKTTGKRDTKRFFTVFDADIPLFSQSLRVTGKMSRDILLCRFSGLKCLLA